MEDRFKDLKFTIPYPPSLNVYWRNFRGRMVLSAEAKKYKRQVYELFNDTDMRSSGKFSGDSAAFWNGPSGRAIGLKIDVYRPRKSGDLDNTLKAILDSLNGNLYEDDRQVIEIHAHRHDDKDNPRVEIGVRFAVSAN